jgi:septum formation protein
MSAQPSLILASASPRRRELLARIGVAFEVVPSDTDESVRPGEEAVAYARRVAADKALAARAVAGDRAVVAADTVVEVDGDILGKAGSADQALAMLRRLVGRSHRVTTAFVVACADGRTVERQVTTEVDMRAASDAELAAYVAAGEWRGKAGAYAIQAIAGSFVTDVRGSFTNVVGLPLAEVLADLRALGALPEYPPHAFGVGGNS